jgi:hypothetical protein
MQKSCMLLNFFGYPLFFSSCVLLAQGPSSESYVSGDTIVCYCDHIFGKNFNPEIVKKGDIVYVCSEPQILYNFFTNFHPCIHERYILVTHNSDENITQKYLQYIEDPKIFVWFAQNVGYIHPKLKPLPIGLENEHWGRNYKTIINELVAQGINKEEKEYLLFLNFNINTNPAERLPAYNYFSKQTFCYCPPTQSVPDYLRDICHSKFVVSPHGNGLDCHRTWEALYMGIFPVVKTSTLDALYTRLPVIIVDDWCDVTQEFLEKRYREMIAQTYKWEKLYIYYWINKFNKMKNRCKES